MSFNQDQIVFLNGDFMKAGEAKISAFDRGFIFGDGIYEVVPVVHSRLVDRQDFWDRFEASMAKIELKLPYTKAEFEKILYEAIAKNSINEGGVYIQITRGVAARTFEFLDLAPSIFIFCYEAKILQNPLAKSGISVISTEDIRWKRRDIKSISLLGQCYAKTQATKAGAYEAIMCENGFVTEGASSSVFIIKNGTLITKALSNEILPSIRRKRILVMATNLGLKTELRDFSIDELYESDEAFICAATLPILPIIRADSRDINGGKVGEICTNLIKLYTQNMLDEAAKK